jgi:hypothetical protein
VRGAAACQRPHRAGLLGLGRLLEVERRLHLLEDWRAVGIGGGGEGRRETVVNFSASARGRRLDGWRLMAEGV